MYTVFICSQDHDHIEKYYREKYAEAPEGEFDEYEEQPEDIRQQSLLPGVKLAHNLIRKRMS